MSYSTEMIIINNMSTRIIKTEEMIEKSLRRHTLTKTYFITCEEMSYQEALDWKSSIIHMINKGYVLVDFKVEGNDNNTVRCVVEYTKTNMLKP